MQLKLIIQKLIMNPADLSLIYICVCVCLCTGFFLGREWGEQRFCIQRTIFVQQEALEKLRKKKHWRINGIIVQFLLKRISGSYVWSATVWFDRSVESEAWSKAQSNAGQFMTFSWCDKVHFLIPKLIFCI